MHSSRRTESPAPRPRAAPLLRLVAVMLLAVLAVLASSATARAARWTVLVYMAADNSLEPYAADSIAQLTTPGPSAETTVVLQLQRGLRYSDAPFADAAPVRGTRRYLVHPGGLTLLADLGAADGSRPATLADFVASGVREHPADHYAIVLWDHGFAWQGCCEAESADRQHLTLADLRAGIGAGLRASGLARLDLVAFDACLMGGIEVAHALADLARALVASADLEPASGWDYAALLTAFAAAPNDDPLVIARRLAAAYAAAAPDLTAAVVDLDQLPALVAATSALADAVIADAGAAPFADLAAAQEVAERYGGPLAAAYGLVDLGGLAASLGAAAGPAARPATAVVAALQRALPFQSAAPAHPAARGLSIHLPVADLASEATYQAIDFAQRTRWGELSRAYAATLPPCVDGQGFCPSAPAPALPLGGCALVSPRPDAPRMGDAVLLSIMILAARRFSRGRGRGWPGPRAERSC